MMSACLYGTNADIFGKNTYKNELCEKHVQFLAKTIAFCPF